MSYLRLEIVYYRLISMTSEAPPKRKRSTSSRMPAAASIWSCKASTEVYVIVFFCTIQYNLYTAANTLNEHIQSI